MGYKKPFDDALREFKDAHPGEVEHMTPEQLAEQMGYSLSVTRHYYQGIEASKRREKEKEEESRIRASEEGVVTYVTSSGNARVLYYPLLGEAKILSNYERARRYSRHPGIGLGRGAAILLPAQDTIEIGIYLLGLQPHIRDVVAKKPQLSDDSPSDTEDGTDLSHSSE